MSSKKVISLAKLTSYLVNRHNNSYATSTLFGHLSKPNKCRFHSPAFAVNINQCPYSNQLVASLSRSSDPKPHPQDPKHFIVMNHIQFVTSLSLPLEPFEDIQRPLPSAMLQEYAPLLVSEPLPSLSTHLVQVLHRLQGFLALRGTATVDQSSHRTIGRLLPNSSLIRPRSRTRIASIYNTTDQTQHHFSNPHLDTSLSSVYLPQSHQQHNVSDCSSARGTDDSSPSLLMEFLRTPQTFIFQWFPEEWCTHLGCLNHLYVCYSKNKKEWNGFYLIVHVELISLRWVDFSFNSMKLDSYRWYMRYALS